MAVKMDEFLLEYYRRLIFQRMPVEQFARFGEYLDKNDLVGDQKSWTNMLEKDAAGNYVKRDGLYVRLPLPDPTDTSNPYYMDDEEWVKLYQAFQQTFQSMDANKSSLTYNSDAKDFLNDYFGTAKLFTYAQASVDAQTEIDKIKNILDNNRDDARRILTNAGILTDAYDLDNLIEDITNKKYNKDLKKQQLIKNVAYNLSVGLNQTGDQVLFHGKFDVEKINSGFKVDPIALGKMDDFKSQYTSLLNKLYSNKKISDAFQANDSTKISPKLNEAKEHVNYDDSSKDEYLPPKRSDELTIIQKFSDWCDETYDNYFDKYIRFHGDRMFFSPSARLIFKEITKQGIKPVDGIAKILESKDKILSSLQTKNHTAHKHFKWFVETLDELQKDKQLAKTFAGALKNGAQLRNLVSEIIIKAIKDGKIDEAKTTLEIISVIKYGYTTSKIMDTLRKTDLTIFSDKNLSWNKNDTMKFITNAMDKSIKTAFMGIGYGITIMGNAFRLNGSKFNGRAGKMANMRTAYNAQNDAERATRRTELNDNINNADAEIANQQTILGTLTTNQANLGARERDLATRKENEKNAKDAYDTAQRTLDATNITLKDYNDLDAQINQLQTDLNKSQTNLTKIQNLLNTARGATPPNPDYIDYLTQLETDTKNQIFQTNADITAATTQQNALRTDPAISAALAARPAQETAAQNAKTAYENAKTDRQTLGTDIKKFKDATAEVQSLIDYKERLQKEFDKWDKGHKDTYKELMAYWDMLETGRDSHMGKMYSWTPGSKDKKQKAFDGDAIYQQYLANYQMQP